MTWKLVFISDIAWRRQIEIPKLIMYDTWQRQCTHIFSMPKIYANTSRLKAYVTDMCKMLIWAPQFGPASYQINKYGTCMPAH